MSVLIEYNVKIYSKEADYVDMNWINLVEGIVLWRVLVNKIMEISVYKKRFRAAGF
jgi:hypothetical protein